jgi:hypothetical protein
MLKDWEKVYERIKDVPGLDEHEKIQYARSLAATPAERWQMNVNFLQSLGLWGRYNAQIPTDRNVSCVD